jgi:hypothetical protein
MDFIWGKEVSEELSTTGVAHHRDPVFRTLFVVVVVVVVVGVCAIVGCDTNDGKYV